METDSRGWIKRDTTFVAPDRSIHNYFEYRNRGDFPQIMLMWKQAWEEIEGSEKDAILKAYKGEIETLKRLNTKDKKKKRKNNHLQ